MVTPAHQRHADQVAELRGLVRVLLDESGLIVPSITASADQSIAPTITVDGLELEGGKAPTEFRIFRAGENPSTKGTFIFDEEAAASVMAAYAARGLDLMMDFEHMSLVKPPIIAPASCKRWVPQIRNGELWATECGWTNRARGMIEEGELRYFSPAFNFDPKTMRVMSVINCALTNNPALDAITPLVKASENADDSTTDEPPTKERPAMFKKMKCSTATCSHSIGLKGVDGDEEMCKAADGEEAYCAQCKASAVLSGVGQKVITALGLTADVGEAAALSATAQLTGLRTELATLTGKDAPAAQLGMIASWKAGAEKAAALEAEIGELKTAALSAEVATLLDNAGRDGKLPPAERADLEKRMKGADGKPSRAGIEFAREYLSTRTPAVQAGEVKGPAGGIALDPQEVTIARNLGQDPAEYAKWKAQKMGAVISK